ncbi:2-isopropylmalate synthase [bacterium]|nr:2-isopropylmalate synthase [bacterium]
MDKVLFFDTTLRDGEQSPGINLNAGEKLEIAEQLARLRVDIIEAGFPIASEGDFNAVKAIADRVRGPVICALARANEADIACAGRAIAGAEKPRIHTFISSSPSHLKHQLKKSEAEVLEIAVRSVRQAKALCRDVEFSAMDATRSDVDYLIRMFNAAIEAGATTINVPDTVGYALPDEYAHLIATLRRKVKGAGKVVWSVHCHDDLGLAVANSLAAIAKGARQVEVAINGIGERAGNAALEEVAMAIRTRRDLMKVDTNLDVAHIGDTSRKVSRLTGYPIPRNKAVVGTNAFLHESGIHQDGVLKERSTYEIMQPEQIGHRADNIVLGKHSGRHAFSKKLEELGIHLAGDDLERAFKKFKDTADAKKNVAYQELEAIAYDVLGVVPDELQIETYQSLGGINLIPYAVVRLSKKGRAHEATASGDGQIDALYRAIAKAARFKGRLLRYHVEAATQGQDAMGEVTVTVSDGDLVMQGRGSSTDVVEASARAYLNAINRLAKKKAMPKTLGRAERAAKAAVRAAS